VKYVLLGEIHNPEFFNFDDKYQFYEFKLSRENEREQGREQQLLKRNLFQKT